MISILILTHNEEDNLPRCLEAVSWSDDIVVLDSFSTDSTVEIALAQGARVLKRAFANEHDQRTYSLENISFKNKWVYNPDADEVLTPELRDEMLGIAGDEGRREVAFEVRFKTMFRGKWLRYSSLYPTWVVRFFQPRRIRFERSVNLEYIVDGPVGKLSNHFLHYTFNKGYDAWFAKHNSYSTQEAMETLKSLETTFGHWKHLAFGGDDRARRRALKELSFRLPCRPALRFLYMYLIRGGILDGSAGFTYCRLLSIYEYMIVLKVSEFRRRKEGLTL